VAQSSTKVAELVGEVSAASTDQAQGVEQANKVRGGDGQSHSVGGQRQRGALFPRPGLDHAGLMEEVARLMGGVA
jgi:hypothetical protein